MPCQMVPHTLMLHLVILPPPQTFCKTRSCPVLYYEVSKYMDDSCVMALREILARPLINEHVVGCGNQGMGYENQGMVDMGTSVMAAVMCIVFRSVGLCVSF